MKFSEKYSGALTRDAPFSSPDELYHFGVKGMKWGLRRYQNEDGSLTDEGRSHYGYSLRRTIHNIREARLQKKAAKKRAKALEAARKAKAEKKAHNDAKKKAIETGSAEDVLKFKNELSTKEKNDIYNRLMADENLARIAGDEARRREENSKWNKMVKVTKKASELADAISNATKLYNQGAKIYNSFSDEKLPVIGENAPKSAKEKYGESMKMASALKDKFGDLSLEEINAEKDRVTAMRNIEQLAAGENPSGGGKGKGKDKKGK